jgi:thiamine pyrophosphokinase
MSLTSSKTDRDFNKYRDAGGNNTKVAVTLENQDLGLIVDQASSTVIYIGEGLYGALTSEAKWKIKKIDLSSGVRITCSSELFDQVWDNRESIIYV